MAYRAISLHCFLSAVIQNGCALPSSQFSERNATRLLRHEVDVARRGHDAHTSNSTNTRDLVVAVCEENIGWIEQQAHKFEHVYVYSKCKGERRIPLPRFKATNVIVRELRNVGSCDNAYLNYIIERWDHLPDAVEFTKGSVDQTGLPPLVCSSCEGRPGSCDTNVDKTPDPEHIFLNGKPNTNKPTNKMTPFFEFHLQKYKFHANDQQPFKPSGYKNMGDWVDHASPLISRQMYLDACCVRNYGGHMTATREQIRNDAYFKGTARGLYQALLSQQNDANEEVDHFIERTWMSVFCAKKHEELAIRS